MNREIKYRAWDKSENQMARSVTELLFNNKGLYGVKLNHMGFEFMRRIKDIELMQYTSLKDKNGKEIYEGDIITVGNLIGTIEYSGAWTSFTIRTPKSKILEFRLMCDLDVRDEEVIGNIHENPELLEAKE